MAELGIKGPLEYLQVQATTLVSLLLIPIACKITKFSLYLYDIFYIADTLNYEEWVCSRVYYWTLQPLKSINVFNNVYKNSIVTLEMYKNTHNT